MGGGAAAEAAAEPSDGATACEGAPTPAPESADAGGGGSEAGAGISPSTTDEGAALTPPPARRRRRRTSEPAADDAYNTRELDELDVSWTCAKLKRGVGWTGLRRWGGMIYRLVDICWRLHFRR